MVAPVAAARGRGRPAPPAVATRWTAVADVGPSSEVIIGSVALCVPFVVASVLFGERIVRAARLLFVCCGAVCRFLPSMVGVRPCLALCWLVALAARQVELGVRAHTAARVALLGRCGGRPCVRKAGAFVPGAPSVVVAIFLA